MESKTAEQRGQRKQQVSESGGREDGEALGKGNRVSEILPAKNTLLCGQSLSVYETSSNSQWCCVIWEPNFPNSAKYLCIFKFFLMTKEKK